jgi:arsenate reductase
VPLYLAAQIVGGVLAVLLVRVLYPGLKPAQAADVVIPQAAAFAGRRPISPRQGGSHAPP